MGKNTLVAICILVYLICSADCQAGKLFLFIAHWYHKFCVEYVIIFGWAITTS